MITIHTKTITESTAGFCDIIDITAKFTEQIRAAAMRNGAANLFVNGSTAALTTIEHEPCLVKDLKEFLDKHIPAGRRYHHDDRWCDELQPETFEHQRRALHASCHRSHLDEFC